jgi:thiamine pyrophosphokinase
VDQAFSLINQLYKSFPRPLYLLSSKSISFLLHTGRNRIHASHVTFGPCCGIIPTSGPTKITLEGFRWNLGMKYLDGCANLLIISLLNLEG